ncbi:MAG: hypothetical protein K0R97_3265 [Oerskovia sp.]|nr:hypothetical protein [Oerskovia sp.]
MFRKSLAIAVGAVLIAAGMLVAPAASADITTGNAKTECQSAGFGDGVKLNTGADGVYDYGTAGQPWEPDDIVGLTLHVEIVENVISWNSNTFMDAVLVKAGPAYDVFPGGFEGEGLTPSSGQDISHVTWCFGEAPPESLSVSKTVVTTYDRAHHWDLDKSVAPAEVWLYAPGGVGSGQAQVDWQVDVTYGGYTDSGHTVSGVITVLNDGAGAAAVSGVTDTMTIDGSPVGVAVDCGIDFSLDVAFLEPGGELVCTYSQAVTGLVEGFNTASATTLLGNTYTSGDESITWGAPANESDESVTVTDVSEVGDVTREDTFTAPTGGSIAYSHTFMWEDFDVCGDYAYDNTATLTGDGGTVLEQITKTVDVHVQCLIFDDETAWAANAGPGTLPYNKKGGGNWATYVQYPNTAPVVKVYDVYAGQTMLVGTVTITPIGGGKVTVKTYSNAPSGNPSPGQFAYKTTCTTDPCTSGAIPVAKFYGIHLDVGVWMPDPVFGP